jgi:cytoskeletal protein RodZ
MKNINRSNGRKKLILLTAGVLVLVGIYLLIAWKNHLPPFANVDRTYEPGEQVVNMKKSDSEKKTSEAIEKDPSKKLQNTQTDTPAQPETSDTSGKQIVNVLVTNAGVFNGKVSASGLATNAAETGGVCEFIFTSADVTFSKKTDTMQNPTSTSCKTVSFDADELTRAGTWSVYIHYVSSASEGKSSPKEFQK